MSQINAFFQNGYVQKRADGCTFIYMDENGQRMTHSEPMATASCGNAPQSNGLGLLDSLLAYRGLSRTAPGPANGWDILGTRKNVPQELVIQSRQDGASRFVARAATSGRWSAFAVANDYPFNAPSASTWFADNKGSNQPQAKPEESADYSPESWPTWAKVVAVFTVGIALFYGIKKLIAP